MYNVNDQPTCIYTMATTRATCWCFCTCFPTELILGTMCCPILEESAKIAFVSGSTIKRDVDLGWSTSNIWCDVIQEVPTQNRVGVIVFFFSTKDQQIRFVHFHIHTFSPMQSQVLLEYAWRTSRRRGTLCILNQKDNARSAKWVLCCIQQQLSL